MQDRCLPRARAALLGMTALLWAAPVVAWASPPCVEVDASRDTLGQVEARAAGILLEQVLIDLGRPVAAPCVERWVVSHVQLGERVSVSVRGPGGEQRMEAAALEELPVVYERLVRAVASGEDVAKTAGRHTVIEDETSARQARIHGDNLRYFALGGGAGASGGGAYTGFLLGAGWRHELDHFALDISSRVQIPGSGAIMREEVGSSFTIFRIAGLGYFDGESARSGYLGGGLGLGGAVGERGGGFGLQGDVVAGVAMMRHARTRLLLQLDLGLPMWTDEGGEWMPSVGASIAAARVR